MDPRDKLPRPSVYSTAWYGKIAKAPTDITDTLEIVLPDFDEQLRWGPCRWQSRDDVSLPKRGDSCLVLFDNRNKPWVVAWWPF